MVLPSREVPTNRLDRRVARSRDLIDQSWLVAASSRRLGGDRGGWGRTSTRSRSAARVGRRSQGDAICERARGGDLIVYLDSDTRQFSAHFACGLLGPLLSEDGVQFVKGHFRRPFSAADGRELPADGGRVTELTARPLLSAFYPELAAFAQPLAGEVAARRSLLERLPFACGYAIETSMLLHARHELSGTEAMAQVDLDVRYNAHKSLRDLGPMADACRVILERLRDDGPARRSAPPLQGADGA